MALQAPRNGFYCVWRFSVSKAEWGIKRLCPGCSALYYDMKKAPPVCPKCSMAFDPEALLKSRRKMMPDEAAKKKVAAAPAPEEEVEDIEVEEDAADEAVAEVEDMDDDEEIEVDVSDDKDG